MKKVFDKSTFPANQPFKSAPQQVVGSDENLPSSQSNSRQLSQSTLKPSGTPIPVEASSSVFNGHLKRRQPSMQTNSFASGAPATRLDIIPNPHAQPRRHMYNKPSERAAAINERIERMAQKWTENGYPCKFEDLAHPARAHPVRKYSKAFCSIFMLE